MLLRYLRGLSAPRAVLWCYLIWYLGVVIRYFDPSPVLWLTSLGLGAIMGTALYLSTAYAGTPRTRLNCWQVLRFFVMPFCVSSFAALIKGRGFILVFHPELEDNLQMAGLCALFLGVVVVVKRAPATRASPSLGS